MILPHFQRVTPIVFTGSRQVSLVMEGSLIRSARASHYGMLYYTWSPMYLCLLLERTWSCFPLRIACFPLRLHPKMDSPMLRYSLSTLASKAICHLIYPFKWQVSIHLLVHLAMDGVVVVDLEYNRTCTSEEIPPTPEPGLSTLRGEILKLLYPNEMGIDQMKAGLVNLSEQYFKGCNKPWGEDHDLQLSTDWW